MRVEGDTSKTGKTTKRQASRQASRAEGDRKAAESRTTTAPSDRVGQPGMRCHCTANVYMQEN